MPTVAYADGSNWAFASLPNPSPVSCGFDVLIVAFLYTTNQVMQGQGKPTTADGWLTFYYGFELDAGTGNAYKMSAAYAAWLKTFQQNGGKVLISIGGAEYWGIVYQNWAKAPATVAANLVSFLGNSATANGFAFDGVDIDYEDSPALVLPSPATNPNNKNGYDGVTLMVTLTLHLRFIAGPSFLITHAPQPQYVTNWPGSAYNISGYIPILAIAGTEISWLNIQMYNQDPSWLNPSGMSTVFTPLLQGTASAVYLGATYTAPVMAPGRLAIGKPLESIDATGYVTPDMLPLLVQQALPGIPHTEFPIMFWALNSCTTDGCSGEQAMRISDIMAFTVAYRSAGLRAPVPSLRSTAPSSGCAMISLPSIPGSFQICRM